MAPPSSAFTTSSPLLPPPVLEVGEAVEPGGRCLYIYPTRAHHHPPAPSGWHLAWSPGSGASMVAANSSSFGADLVPGIRLRLRLQEAAAACELTTVRRRHQAGVWCGLQARTRPRTYQPQALSAPPLCPASVSASKKQQLLKAPPLHTSFAKEEC